MNSIPYQEKRDKQISFGILQARPPPQPTSVLPVGEK